MAEFRAGLHVTGHAAPEARVVAHLSKPVVSGVTPLPARRAWINIAMARWLAERSRAAIAAYSELQP